MTLSSMITQVTATVATQVLAPKAERQQLIFILWPRNQSKCQKVTVIVAAILPMTMVQTLVRLYD